MLKESTLKLSWIRGKLGISPASIRIIAIYSGLGIGAILVLIPLLWLFSLSLKPPGEVFTPTPTFLPRSPTLENFVIGWSKSGFQRFFRNSFIIAGSAVIFSLLFNSLAGYALAKHRFPGRQIIFLAFLSSIMIPDQVRAVPLFMVVTDLDWVNTWQGVIIPGINRAFGVFLMKQYIETIPDEMLDAARIDGASELRIISQIIIPLSKPALATVALFEFLVRWKDLLWPLIVLKSNDMHTVQIGLAQLHGDPAVGGGPIMAMALISIVPILILFLALQPYFIQGIARTGMHG
jgi:ABC-type glycerol-3-phosphate transport system permease component